MLSQDYWATCRSIRKYLPFDCQGKKMYEASKLCEEVFLILVSSKFFHLPQNNYHVLKKRKEATLISLELKGTVNLLKHKTASQTKCFLD